MPTGTLPAPLPPPPGPADPMYMQGDLGLDPEFYAWGAE